jgi:hypothetical protein
MLLFLIVGAAASAAVRVAVGGVAAQLQEREREGLVIGL